jgi:hypothetical protein
MAFASESTLTCSGSQSQSFISRKRADSREITNLYHSADSILSSSPPNRPNRFAPGDPRIGFGEQSNSSEPSRTKSLPHTGQALSFPSDELCRKAPGQKDHAAAVLSAEADRTEKRSILNRKSTTLAVLGDRSERFESYLRSLRFLQKV